MEIVSDAQAAAFTPAVVKPPVWAACLPAADTGRFSRIPDLGSGLTSAKGTGVSGIGAQASVPPQILGQPPIRKTHNYMTRVYAFGGGAPGPYPAREPEPV